MALTTLKEDLLREFREERIMISEQLDLLDPLATSMRKPAARRLIHSTALILAEFLCYALSIGGIVLIVMLQGVYPFSVLSNVIYNSEYSTKLGANNLLYLSLTIYGMVGLLVLVVFMLGRASRVIRQKNDILNLAGKDIKTIVEQHLVRKAEIDTIEQRHLLDISGINLPEDHALGVTGYAPEPKDTVNGVYNPAYGG